MPLKPTKVIRPENIGMVPVEDVVAGMVTIDGIILAISIQDTGQFVQGRRIRQFWLEHRSVTYAQETRDKVQVIGRVSQDVLDATLESMKANGERLVHA